MTGTPDTRHFAEHPLPRAQWPAFVGKRPDAELAGRPDLPVAEQLRLARHHRPRTRAVLARNPCIGPDVQRILAEDGAAVLALAGNRGLCQEVQRDLLSRGDARIIRAVASSATLAPAVRDALAGSAKYRAALARNPDLPDGMYLQLLQSGDSAVRVALAGNRAAGPVVLAAIAGDRRDQVRWRVAGNPALPVSAQQVLARDHDKSVQHALAGNPSLDPQLQLAMASEGEAVLLMLARNPALVPDAVDALLVRSGRFRCQLAAHPRLTTAQQRRLANNRDQMVLGSLAANPCLGPELQERLSTRRSRSVHIALARNPALPSGVQVRLAVKDDAYLRSLLAVNPALDRPALRILLDARAAGRWRWHADDTPRVPALGLATHWTPASLDHPVLGPLVALLTGKPGVLTAAAVHPDPLVRWALLGNDRIGADRLGRLITDAEPAIAAGARARFLTGLAG